MKKQLIYNNSNRKNQRRYLRNKMTNTEKLLWAEIRKKQLGHIFRRQYSIRPYIVDFYCPTKRLIIEIDGNQHKYSQDYDNFRSNYFSTLDMMIIRFWNWEIESNIDKVVTQIKTYISPSRVEGDQGGV